MPNADQRREMQMSLNRINNRRPPFPCIAVFFAKDPQITGNKVIRFSDQDQFDKFVVQTVAMTRVALHTTDLLDVPIRTLLHIYNQYRSTEDELPWDYFPESMDTPSIRQLVFDVLPHIATPFEETPMGTSSTPENGTAPTSTGTTSTEAKAAEKAAAKAAKDKEKEDRKAATAAKRADGVIGNIKAALDTEKGITQNEMLDILEKKFPDRSRDGMSSTVKIQFSRLQKSTGRDIHNAMIEGRGRVYKFKDKGAVPGKVVTAPATGEAAATSTPSNGAPPSGEAVIPAEERAAASTGPVGTTTPTTPAPQAATATAPAKAAAKAPAPAGAKTAGKK